jgi:hypothetical protein
MRSVASAIADLAIGAQANPTEHETFFDLHPRNDMNLASANDSASPFSAAAKTGFVRASSLQGAMSWRSIIVLAALGVGTAAVFAAWLVAGWGGPWVIRAVDDIGMLWITFYAASCSAVAAWRARAGHRAAWTWLATGLYCSAVGEAIWAYYQVWQGQEEVPFPSLADAAFLLFPVGACLALIRFPVGHTFQSRSRLVLDGIIVAGSFLVLSWLTVLNGVYQAGGTSPFAFALSLAYPVADVVMITIAVLVMARARSHQRVTLGLLTGGIALVAFSDSAFAYLTADGTYNSGNLVDLGWVAGFLVLGVAALAHMRAPHTDSQTATVPGPGALWLPYVPLALATVLATVHVVPHLAAGPIVLIVVLLVAAVLVRQYLVVSENRRILAMVSDQALRDPLTGLANRTLFFDRLTHALTLQA